MRLLATLALAFAAFFPLNAEVVRPSPDFSWVDSSGATHSSKEFRGRALVVLIANSPREWAFRSQVGQLQQVYQRLAAEKVVCVAAFSGQSGLVRSNIPFVVPPDGASVAGAFQATRGFSMAIIGKDGNLDYFGPKILPAQRVYDIITNSFAFQQALRRF